MLLEYNAVKFMNLMVTVLPISKFGIVSSYVIKYALLIVGIESNPGPFVIITISDFDPKYF
jgi:hypothetical protein